MIYKSIFKNVKNVKRFLKNVKKNVKKETHMIIGIFK